MTFVPNFFWSFSYLSGHFPRREGGLDAVFERYFRQFWCALKGLAGAGPVLHAKRCGELM